MDDEVHRAHGPVGASSGHTTLSSFLKNFSISFFLQALNHKRKFDIKRLFGIDFSRQPNVWTANNFSHVSVYEFGPRIRTIDVSAFQKTSETDGTKIRCSRTHMTGLPFEGNSKLHITVFIDKRMFYRINCEKNIIKFYFYKLLHPTGKKGCSLNRLMLLIRNYNQVILKNEYLCCVF